MYKLHLILKYLRKRRIAWVSLLAVMLCTAMVIIVISIMGGWMRMLEDINHELVGDLVIENQFTSQGFAHYQELMEKIQSLPEVRGAAPEIHTGGIINLNNQVKGRLVEIFGLDLGRLRSVNGFVGSLHLQPDELDALAKQYADAGDDSDAKAVREKAKTFPSFEKLLSPETYRLDYAAHFPNAKTDAAKYPGVILGSSVGLGRDEKGQISRPPNLYDVWAHIAVVPNLDLAEKGLDSPTVIPAWVIDDSHTKFYGADSNRVYLPFDVLQHALLMDPQTYIDKASGQTMTSPARCNEIYIGLKDGFKPDAVKPKIELIVQALQEKYHDADGLDGLKIETWRQRQAEILDAVEHEKGLLVILFGIVSLCAVMLIFCIFFMIVVEKTKDIGIIKSVGATGAGVAGIFLGYGLSIGILGAGAGLGMAYLVVHNIRELHEMISRVFGITIWDPRVYAFDVIPNTMDPNEVAIILTVAVLASVLGSLVPAVRAARMNPVEALRWE